MPVLEAVASSRVRMSARMPVGMPSVAPRWWKRMPFFVNWWTNMRRYMRRRAMRAPTSRAGRFQFSVEKA